MVFSGYLYCILSKRSLNIPKKQDLDGIDLFKLLTSDPDNGKLLIDNEDEIRNEIMQHFPHGAAIHSTIRIGDYKLIHNFEPDKPLELYRLYENGTKRVDIEEMNNLSARLPEKAAAMNSILYQRLNEVNFSPTENKNYIYGTMNTHQSALKAVTFQKLLRLGILSLFAGLVLGGCKPKEDIPESKEGLKIVYIRHAEGGHNVKKNWQTYTDIPEDQWPVWVGKHTIFTPTGKGRLARVAGKLKRYDFDFIASSTAWRSQNTILPYMKELGAKGEVWPELAELYHSSLIISPDLPTPGVKILGEGSPIELPEEEALYFSLREDGQNNFKLPKFPRDHSDNVNETAASKVVLQRAVDMILERFDGTDKTILLAGHGSSGKGILKLLLNDELLGFPSIEHASIWMVEQQPNGEFKIKIFNDVPLDYDN